MDALSRLTSKLRGRVLVCMNSWAVHAERELGWLEKVYRQAIKA